MITSKKAKGVSFGIRLFAVNIQPQKLCAVNLARTKATGAYRNGLGCTVNYSLYLADIGLPSSVGLSVRVRNIVTENNTFSTNIALCHY